MKKEHKIVDKPNKTVYVRKLNPHIQFIEIRWIPISITGTRAIYNIVNIPIEKLDELIKILQDFKKSQEG